MNFERTPRPSGRGRAVGTATKTQGLGRPASYVVVSQSRKLSTGRSGVPPVVAPCPNAPGVDAVGQGCTSAGGNHRRVTYGSSADSPTSKQRQPRSRLSTLPTRVGGVRPMARPVSVPPKGRNRTHTFGRSPLLRSGDRARVEPQAGESATDWRRHAPTAPTWCSRPRYSLFGGGSYRRGSVGVPDAPTVESSRFSVGRMSKARVDSDCFSHEGTHRHPQASRPWKSPRVPLRAGGHGRCSRKLRSGVFRR